MARKKSAGLESERRPAASSSGATAHEQSVAAAAGPFNEILQRTLALSRAASLEHAASAAAAGTPAPAQHALALSLNGLEPEAVLKLRILMLAGRDARSGLDTVQEALTAGERDPAFVSNELSQKGALLSDYLRRGHAIACATRFDLEAPVTMWRANEAVVLDERVWLRFGKQLAESEPGEWQCLALLDKGRDKQMSKLYLRRGEEGWWSFDSVLDRPSPSSVSRQQPGRNSKKATNAPLVELAEYTCQPSKRALRRALRALHARLGLAGD